MELVTVTFLSEQYQRYVILSFTHSYCLYMTVEDRRRVLYMEHTPSCL